MGFGYLLIGYLITFVLSMTARSLDFSGLALLAGYAIMMGGLSLLSYYHSAFVRAKWSLIPLMLCAVYQTLADFDALLLLELPIFGSVVWTIYEWVSLALLVGFNLLMLYAIHRLAQEVELPKLSVSAVRNAIFLGVYVVITILAAMPFAKAIAGYLLIASVCFDLAWIFCNLFLLLACTKSICAEGDEDQPAKPAKGWIGRMNEAYERNRQRAVETKTRETEEFLRRRKEKRELKQQRKNQNQK